MARDVQANSVLRLLARLSRLQVFDGVPPPFDKKKRMVIPEALRVNRLRPGRRYTNMGRMASEVGWKHWDTVKELEAKRKVKSEAYWAKKKDLIKVFFFCVFFVLRSSWGMFLGVQEFFCRWHARWGVHGAIARDMHSSRSPVPSPSICCSRTSYLCANRCGGKPSSRWPGMPRSRRCRESSTRSRTPRSLRKRVLCSTVFFSLLPGVQLRCTRGNPRKGGHSSSLAVPV